MQQPIIRALWHHGISGGLVYLNPTDLLISTDGGSCSCPMPESISWPRLLRHGLDAEKSFAMSKWEKAQF
jgi:hypothetical protein